MLTILAFRPNLLHLPQTLLQNIFIDWLSLARHGTFVSGDLVGLKQQAIGGQVHAFMDVQYVSNQQEVLVDGDLL